MGAVSIIGVDLAKNVFLLHGAAADGSFVFRKKLSRVQFAGIMDEPHVAMEGHVGTNQLSWISVAFALPDASKNLKIQRMQKLTIRRRFDVRPIPSATCPRESVLPIRPRPDFLVVFEGYAGGADH